MEQFSKFIAVVAALVAGALTAFQARVNGGLGEAMGDGIGAALYSFTTGWLAVAIFFIFSRPARAGLANAFRMLRTGELPIWMVLGGAFGGFLVMTQGLAAGALGVSLFAVAVVAGQGISGILIDSRGWFGIQKRRLNLSRLIGAATVIVGVTLVAESPDSGTLLLLALPFVAGLGLGFQQAANGKVRIRTGSAVAATFINFAMGSLFLLIAKLVTLPTVGLAEQYPTQWWLYLGGVAGAVYIAIQIVTVARIGVLGLGVLLGTGQLVGSLLIDLLYPIGDQALSWLHVVGVFITLAGALLVNLKR